MSNSNTQKKKKKKKQKSYGKEFERQVFEGFSCVPDLSIDRIPDQVTRYRGSSSNICDFIAYKKPKMLYLECKSVHGNLLSIYSIPKLGKDGNLHGFYGDIRDGQWDGLLTKSVIPGISAGILCWWVDKDVTLFIPIQELKLLRDHGNKSVRFDIPRVNGIFEIPGVKKRVLFTYDFESVLSLF